MLISLCKFYAIFLVQLTPYYDTDFNLLRWLKGHDYNLEVIKPKLINHLMMRKLDWDLDNLPDKPRNHPVHKHWKRGITGEATKTPNCIVNIEQSGGNDYWGMMKTHPINEILRARLHDLESMLRAIMELEKKTGEQCAILYIMDLTGLKLDHRCMTLITACGETASFLFRTVARPLLPERTRNKVNILGSNWKEDILKLADGKCLPTYWNDKGQDGPFLASIERGLSYSPQAYYKGEIPANAKSIHISAGKSGYVDVEAKENTRLKWEIHSNGHFSWTIYEVNEEKESNDLTRMKRVYPLINKIPGPTMVPLLDSMAVPKTSVYRLWFGNQHAWFHTLTVKYVVEVVDEY
uniref:CRAL-TRIO domain-containing protein n=1 Tax=Angiostrongylus cantonensis TaxID=6313 RepID=A0A158P7U5_ANGCA